MAKLASFLKKLLQMLQEPQLENVISWRSDGQSFKVHQPGEFIDRVLPVYFKHKNMASFVRQLNMYGFNRPKDLDQNSYFHPKFKKNRPALLRFIKRKNKQKHDIWSCSESEMSELIVSSEGKMKEKNKFQQQVVNLQTDNEKLMDENRKLISKIQEFERQFSNLSKPKVNAEFMPIQKKGQENGSCNRSTNGDDSDKNKGLHSNLVTYDRCVLILQGKKQ